MFRRSIGSLVALAFLLAPLAAQARSVPYGLQVKRQFAQHLNTQMWHKPDKAHQFDARNIRIVGQKVITPAGMCGPSQKLVTLTAVNTKNLPELRYKATATTLSGFGPPRGELRVSVSNIKFSTQPRSMPIMPRAQQ